MPSPDQYLESADLSIGRLQLSGCGYQGRKSRQSAQYAQDVLDYLQNTESGQKKVEKALKKLNKSSHRNQSDTEFAQYYLLQQALMKFEKEWNAKDRYKTYESLAKKQQKAEDKKNYSLSAQKTFIDAMTGITSAGEVLTGGDNQQQAMLYAVIEKEAKRQAAEELAEEALFSLALVPMLEKVEDVADAARVTNKVKAASNSADHVLDAMDAMHDLEKNADRVDDVADVVKTSYGKSSSNCTELVPYYPANNGAVPGTEKKIYLMAGDKIDRFGGKKGKFFSPTGTPMEMRALPYDADLSQYRQFEVVKPFEVEASTIAPAFGNIGLGTQYRSSVSVDVLLKKGIIKQVGGN